MQRDSSSSSFWDEEEEEDDRRNLNERKPPPPPSFINCRFSSKFQKTYLLLLLLLAILPLFIILLFYFAPNPQYSVFSTPFSSLHQINKESKLRALYLLRQQQLGLLRALNYSREDLEDLKSALSHQISLNSQIQQTLLNPPHVDNYFWNVTSGDRCSSSSRTVDKKKKKKKKRSIEWKPKADKFLLAVCVSGQMSSHLICLEKHMLFAALLKRVLVIPSSKVDYQYDRVLDIDHINKCVGKGGNNSRSNKVVIPFEEFAASASNNNNHHHHHHYHHHQLHATLLCYFWLPHPCFLEEEHLRKMKSSLGLSMSKAESLWVDEVEDATKPKKRTIEDVLSSSGRYDEHPVLAIGDVFYADVVEPYDYWFMQPGHPPPPLLSHHCNSLIQPTRLILLTAHRFIQTFLGTNFLALHFRRRHPFFNFCNAKKPSCFYPIPQAADCILRVLQKANAPVIYLSTDAAETETALLHKLIVLNGRSVPLVKRPPRNSAEKWDALLYRHHIEGDPQTRKPTPAPSFIHSLISIKASFLLHFPS